MRIVNYPNPGNVAQLGDSVQITVPLPNGVIPGDPIGRDIDPAGRPGVLLGGIQNLQNALLRRLQCPRGYLPHHPQYGSRLHRFIGTAQDLASVLEMRDEAARTILDEPRALSVPRLSVTSDGEAVDVDATVETPLGTIELAVAIQRVGG